MSCESNWASPLWIEAFDPYPWHGLVYLAGGVRMLQPSQGRPALPLPPTPPNYYEFQPYTANPALWDIGNPDPPPSQCLFDAGAESLGRCLLDVTALETRVGGVTRRLRVSWGLDRPNELLLTEGGVEVATAAFDRAALLAGVGLLVNPVDGSNISPMIRMDQIDRSNDGRKRLMATVGFASGYVFITGVIIVQIGEESDGSLTLSYTAVANTPDCLGTYTYNRTSDRSSARLSSATGGLELTPIPPEYSTGAGLYPYPHVGSMAEGFERTGMVVGGWLTASGAQLVRCDHSHQVTQSSDPAGSHAEKWQPEDTTYNHEIWRIDYTRAREYSIRLYAGAASVVLTGRDDMKRTASVENDEEFGTPIWPGSIDYYDYEAVTGIGSSTKESVETSWQIVDDFARITSINASAPQDTTKQRAPDSPAFGGSMAVSLTTNCQKARALTVLTSTERFMTAVLTPSGPVGALASANRNVTATAIFNPMTLDTKRSVDHPTIQLLGFV